MSQPVFSLLDGNPEFLVVRGSTRLEVIAFAFIVAFGPPLVAVVCEWLVSRVSPRAGGVLHLIFLGAFLVPVGLLIAKVFDRSTLDGALPIVLATCVAGLAAFVFWHAVRLFLAFSVILPMFGIASFVISVPLATGDAGATPIKIAPRTPIVVVVLDEFPVSSLMTREGQIDAVRYPNFGRLAREATWYRNASAVHWHTTAAVPAILTGRMPRAGELPVITQHPNNLFTLVGASYQLRVHEEITHLCPRKYCPRSDGSIVDQMERLIEDVGVAYLHKTMPRSIAAELPSIDHRWERFIQRGQLLAARNARDIDSVFSGFIFPDGGEFEQFLSEFSPNQSAGTLHFIHLLLPHAPWKFLPSGRRYGFEGIDGYGNRNMLWDDDPWLVQQGLQRHLLQVQYTDMMIGRVIRKLEQIGLYRRALLIVVADHGMSFRPGGARREIRTENFADIAGVPLFVQYPGQIRGRVDLRAARTVDILPTVGDVLGIRLPWRTDGHSLLRPAPSRAEVVVVRRDGTMLRKDIGAVERQMQATIRRNVALLGEGHDSLYRVGRNRILLGTEVATSRQLPNVRIRIAEEERYREIRKSSPFVPARVSGVIEQGEIGPDIELAIAVNNRVQALTRCFRESGTQVFRALVPESAFKEGFNRIKIFAVMVDGSTFRLSELAPNQDRR